MKKSAASFDPYRRWLGIPQAEQPPHHYRLLGLALFEEDVDVIESAADRQMAHVRKFQSGQHSADSQRVLNELAAARLCLLDAARKADYDKRLRLRLENKGELRTASKAAARTPPPVSPPKITPPPAILERPPLPTARPLDAQAAPATAMPALAALAERRSYAPAIDDSEAQGDAAQGDALAVATVASPRPRSPAMVRRRKSSAVLAIVLGLIALAMCVVLAVVLAQRFG